MRVARVGAAGRQTVTDGPPMSRTRSRRQPTPDKQEPRTLATSGVPPLPVLVGSGPEGPLARIMPAGSDTVTRLGAGAPVGGAPAGRLATGRTDHGLQLRHVGVGPAARSGGWSRVPGRSGPTSRRLPGPRRPGRFLRDPAAIGRVAAPRGAQEAAEDRCRAPGRSQTPGAGSGGRRSRSRWTRQHRLPSTNVDGGRFSTIGIAALIALAGVSRRISGGAGRRAWAARPLISSCISPRRPEPRAKKDPRDAATSGGLITTDRDRRGDL